MRQLQEVTEIQKIALYILEKFDEYCKENDVEYFLAYGTLIGAIRHKGFIPWDDDIDVWVKREEYEKILDSFQEWGKKYHLYLNSVQTSDRYNRIFAKICIEKTEVRTLDMINNYKEGCFIDIFVLDGSPNNAFLRAVRIRHLQFWRNMLTLSAYEAYKMPNATRKTKMYGVVARLLRGIDQKKVIQKYEKIAGKSKCNGSVCLLVPYRKSKGKALEVPAAWFDKAATYDFEHISSRVPEGYDPLLKMIYGDYMKLPPVEQRKPGHAAHFFVDEDFDDLGIL